MDSDSGVTALAGRRHHQQPCAESLLVAIAKTGLRVEITTRRPILISTGLQPLQAAVEKVRI